MVQFPYQPVKAIVADADVHSRMEKEGSELVGNTPKEFGVHIRNEVQMWGKLIRETGLRGD